MLKKLEDPPPMNALEVESRDLVKARLDLISEELRQLRDERSKKGKEVRKANARQETIIYFFSIKEQESCIFLLYRNLEM